MKLVVLVNALNIVDAIQTHICLNYCSYCIEANPLMHNPIALILLKPIAVLAWSLILYKISKRRGLVAKTARAMLILLALIFLVAVINNTLVLMHARC